MELRRTLASLVIGPAFVMGLLAPAASAQSASPASAASPATAGTAPASDRPLALGADGLPPLEGPSWRLQSYQRRGQDRTTDPDVAAWLMLRAGRLSGSGGCTALSGRYGTIGQAIAIDATARSAGTEDCPKRSRATQAALLSGLSAARGYLVASDATDASPRLAITDGVGQVRLTFRLDDAADPEAGEWRLSTWQAAGQAVAAVADAPAVLSLRTATSTAARRASVGRLGGSSGCNGLLADYRRTADRLDVGPLERTDAPCAEDMAAQEAAMVRVLESAALEIDVEPDLLVLTAADTGEMLEFTATAPLVGTTWQLSWLRGTPLPATPVTLRIAADEASGEGPCTAYAAQVVTDGRFITFASPRPAAGAGEATATACSSAALGKAQAALLNALVASVLVERAGAAMQLLDARGRTLARFRPASAPRAGAP